MGLRVRRARARRYPKPGVSVWQVTYQQDPSSGQSGPDHRARCPLRSGQRRVDLQLRDHRHGKRFARKPRRSHALLFEAGREGHPGRRLGRLDVSRAHGFPSDHRRHRGNCDSTTTDSSSRTTPPSTRRVLQASKPSPSTWAAARHPAATVSTASPNMRHPLRSGTPSWSPPIQSPARCPGSTRPASSAGRSPGRSNYTATRMAVLRQSPRLQVGLAEGAPVPPVGIPLPSR